MCTLKPSLAVVLALAFGSGAALAQTPRLGKPISEADIKAWDIAVMPDGTGLPPGSGAATQGARGFAEKSSAGHGEGGKRRPLAAPSLRGSAPPTRDPGEGSIVMPRGPKRTSSRGSPLHSLSGNKRALRNGSGARPVLRGISSA